MSSKNKMIDEMKSSYDMLNKLSLAIMHGMAGISAAIDNFKLADQYKDWRLMDRKKQERPPQTKNKQKIAKKRGRPLGSKNKSKVNK